MAIQLDGTTGISTTGNIIADGTFTVGTFSTTNFSVVGNVTGDYIIGNGSQLTGLSAGYSNADVATYLASGTDTDPIITSGNVSGGNVLATGNVTASYFFGNGSQLTGIDAASIQNGTSNVKVVALNGNVSVNINGTPNIAVFSSTGEYVTGVVSASGNITGGNVLTSGLISSTGNVAAGNVISSGIVTGDIVSASGNITGGNVNTSGAVSTTANVAAGNVISSGIITATGNINGNNINATNWVKGANISTGGNVLVDGYISVVGNLYVANIVSTGNLVVEDPLLYLSANVTYPYNYDIGFYSQFTGNPGNTYQHTGFIRDYTDDTWKLFSNVVPEPSGAVDLTNAIYDPMQMGALSATVVSASGNVTGNYILGNGSQLTGITSTTLADDTSTNATYYPTMANVSSGSLSTAFISTTKLTFNPSTGDMGATNFNSLSDENKKTDIETIVEAVELLMHLRGVFFRWKDNGRRSMGMIAQEVESVIPEVVSADENGVKSISYGSIVGLLVEVVKDHELRLQKLEQAR